MMMRRYACLLFMIFGISLVGNSSQALAQQSIAVVDVQKLLGESKAALDIKKQINAQQDKFKGALAKKETKFRDKQKKLIEEQAKLSKEEFAKKRAAFEADVNETRISVQKNKAALDKAFSIGMRTLETEIFTIVQGIAIEKKYDLVLTRNNVFLGNKSLDITQEAMEKLNSALSKVKLKVEK